MTPAKRPVGLIRAALELGQISAKGHGVPRPREGEALWIAPQAKLDLTFVLASPLALRLAAGAEAPLGRSSWR